MRTPGPRVFGLTPCKTQIPEKFLSRFSRGKGPRGSSSYPQRRVGAGGHRAAAWYVGKLDARRETRFRFRNFGFEIRIITAAGGQDPTMQTRELREYCARRGWDVAGAYIDIGISARRNVGRSSTA
jgi:hypothetical protein